MSSALAAPGPGPAPGPGSGPGRPGTDPRDAWLRTIAPVVADERWARAAWTRVAEPGDAQALELVARFGAAEALVRLAEPLEPHHRVLRERAVGVDFAGLRSYAATSGLRVLIPGDEGWPAGLADLECPPIALWLKGPGELAALCARSVAVVGSRAATPYGAGVCSDIAAGLAGAGVTVVSGAAYGIDAQAHLGALSVDGDTVAVLAGGPDRYYPAGNSRLIARIAQVGLLVSEVCPGGAPTKPRFLQRNRLIAAMTRGTLVVEANLRSGSLNTARAAARLCRPVAAVPGPVVSPTSAGCHQLIRDGIAVLVTDAAETTELVGQLGRDAAPRPSAPVRVEDELEPEDQAVLAVLPYRAGVGTDHVGRAAAVPLTQAAASLARLELLGLVLRTGDTWRKAARGRTP